MDRTTHNQIAAGLKSGDVIVKLDNKEVADPKEVQEIVSDSEKGDEIGLEVIRKGKPMRFKAELENRSHSFRFPFEENDHINCFKNFRDFRIDVPHIEIDIPEIDIDFKMDEDFEEKLEQKLEEIENQIQIKTTLFSI